MNKPTQHSKHHTLAASKTHDGVALIFFHCYVNLVDFSTNMGITDEIQHDCLHPGYYFDPKLGGCQSCMSLCFKQFGIDIPSNCKTYCQELHEVLQLPVNEGPDSMGGMEGDVAASVATVIMVSMGVLAAVLLILGYVWWRNADSRKKKLSQNPTSSWLKDFFRAKWRSPDQRRDQRTPIYVGPGARINPHALSETTDVGVPMLPTRKHPQIKKMETMNCSPTSQFLASVQWSPDGSTFTSLSTPVYYPCLLEAEEVTASPQSPTNLNAIFEDVSLHY